MYSQEIKAGSRFIWRDVTYTATSTALRPGYTDAYRITAVSDAGHEVTITLWAGEQVFTP